MNNKGEINVYVILGVAIAIIVGLVLYTSIAETVGNSVTTVTQTNQLVTMPLNGATTDLYGKNIVGAPTVVNRTGSINYGANGVNYSIITVIGTDGNAQLVLKNLNAGLNSTLLNVTYTYEPDGYVSDSGARAITNLIVILTVIAIVIIALYPTLKNKLDFI